jgi:hypothetical protein
LSAPDFYQIVIASSDDPVICAIKEEAERRKSMSVHDDEFLKERGHKARHLGSTYYSSLKFLCAQVCNYGYNWQLLCVLDKARDLLPMAQCGYMTRSMILKKKE